jgi:N-acetylmuramoyl-L-alanine amidase
LQAKVAISLKKLAPFGGTVAGFSFWMRFFLAFLSFSGCVYFFSRLMREYGAGSLDAQTSVLPQEIVNRQHPAPSAQTSRGEIVIDAGHGGEDGGTQGNGILEKEGALEIALEVAEELKSRGYRVTLTRESDVTLSLDQRAALANAREPLCFISIHLNRSAAPSAQGIEVFYAWPKKPDVLRDLRTELELKPGQSFTDHRGRMLAEMVQNALITRTSAQRREVQNNQLVVLNSTRSPAILVECGFVSNEDEAALLQKQSYQRKLARGIADGVAEFACALSADPKTGLETGAAQ